MIKLNYLIENIDKFIKRTFNFSGLILIFFFGCSTIQNEPHDAKCNSIIQLNDRIEIEFSDSSAYSFMLSPFEKDKIWVGFTSEKNKIIEVDLSTKQTDTLSGKYKEIFSPARNFAIYQDDYDSLVWIGGNNRNLLKYDKRTKDINELPIRYVLNIISKPERVYLVAFKGFYYWDREKDSIIKISSVPLEIIHKSTLLDKDNILLDDKYTFNFMSRKSNKGIIFDGDDFLNDNSRIKVKDGILVIYNDSSLKIKTKGKPIQNIDNAFFQKGRHYISIDNPYVWVKFDTTFYTYNVYTNEFRNYWLVLPYVNNYSPNYFFDQNFIWIHRPNQLLLISTDDGRLFKFPFTDNERFRKIIVNNCNTFLLYKNKIIVFNSNEFIKSCHQFNGTAYIEELKKFKNIVDSLQIRKETNKDSVLEKLQFINNLFSETENIGVIKELKKLDISAFGGVINKFPEDYDSCFKNDMLPILYRKYCFYRMFKQYARRVNVDNLVQLDNQYRILLGNPNNDFPEYHQSNMDSVYKFIYYNDSINNLEIATDSLEYLKALSYFTICRTSWFVNEASCYNFNIVHNKLNRFIANNINSLLTDNAEFILIKTGLYDLGESDVKLINVIDSYKKLLTKYPNTDLRPDIEYEIITMYGEMWKNDNEIFEIACRKFIINYPNYIHLDHVRYLLDRIEKKKK